MGAALGRGGEAIAPQRTAQEHDASHPSEQAQVAVERPIIEDLGRMGGAQKRGGSFPRGRKQGRGVQGRIGIG